MDDRLIELYVQRGRLRERIGAQRTQLAGELALWSSALQLIDRSIAVLRLAGQWMTTHPVVLSALVASVLVWRPRVVFRWLRRGYAGWRSWARARDWLRRPA